MPESADVGVGLWICWHEHVSSITATGAPSRGGGVGHVLASAAATVAAEWECSCRGGGTAAGWVAHHWGHGHGLAPSLPLQPG